jgi:hypothetical protein
LSQTLAQLRNRVADRLGDRVELTATSNGTTTTFIDTRNINTGTEDMKGRAILFSDGSVSRITAQVDATSTLTFTPAVSNANLVEAGDVANVFNKRGKGFLPSEYKNAINNAINDAFPLGLIELTDDGGALDITTGEITIDASMYYLASVQYSDEDGYEFIVPKATRTNRQGWRVIPSSGKVVLEGSFAEGIDGLTITLTGYGRQEILSADSDTCLLNAEWIVARALYHLCASSLDKDATYGQLVGLYRDESERKRSRIRTMKQPGWELVRSY